MFMREFVNILNINAVARKMRQRMRKTIMKRFVSINFRLKVPTIKALRQYKTVKSQVIGQIQLANEFKTILKL